MNAPLSPLAGAVLTDNAAWKAAKPRLSVLIPFFRYDPITLLTALDTEADALAGAVEVVILDDGGGDTSLAEAVAAHVKTLAIPTRFVRLLANEGRAKGRNRLAAQSRADQRLFLDCDMLPSGRGFLAAYLAIIDAENPDVVFGGFAAPVGEIPPEQAVHRAMALAGDCVPASVRQAQPEKYVFTSNLLVRRDVFEAEAFDEGFVGWGWEDVEWGMRVGRRFSIRHIDNPAIHLGLDAPHVLARKYEQSVANFARVAERHPQVVATFPSYRVARALRHAPLKGLWRPMLKWTALAEAAPMAARVLALKLYRAALYAEVV